MWHRPDTPVLVNALGALLVIGGVGGVLLVASHRRLLDAERDLAGRTAELLTLVQRRPAPTPANATALGDQLTRVRDDLAATRVRLGNLPEPGTAPATRTDAFFALAAFAERMRTRATAAQVAVGPDERFGFGAFAREGPALAAIPELVRQQRWLEALLPLLFAAGPEEFLGAQRTGGPGGEAPLADPGVFRVDPRLSLRGHDGAAPDGFRLTFTGQTLVLRRFLNTVATGPLPFAVRTEEVENVGEPEVAAGAVPAAKSGITDGWRESSRTLDWLVPRNRSRFLVTIEVLPPAGTPVPAGGGGVR